MGALCSKKVSTTPFQRPPGTNIGDGDLKPNIEIVPLVSGPRGQGDDRGNQISLKELLDVLNDVRLNPSNFVNELGAVDETDLREAKEFLNNQPSLQELELDPGLTAAAYLHSKFMSEKDQLVHTGIDDSQLIDRISEFGEFAKGSLSENIAKMKEFDAKNWILSFVVDAGVDSRANRKNIFGKEMKRVGLGCYFCAENREFWLTMIFTGRGYFGDLQKIPDDVFVDSGLDKFNGN